MSRKNIEKLILVNERRLQELKEKKALYGLDTPPHISIEIEEIESAIENLQKELKTLENKNIKQPSSTSRLDAIEDDAVNIIRPNSELLGILQVPDSSLRQKIRQSEAIDINGVALSKFIPLVAPDLLQALNQGSRFRVILINPASPAFELVTRTSLVQISVDTVKQNFETTRTYLEGLKKKSSNGHIEARTIDILPSYGITFIYPKDKQYPVYCSARIGSFRKSSLESPELKPDPIKDKYWFDFFREQFEFMWAESSRIAIGES